MPKLRHLVFESMNELPLELLPCILKTVTDPISSSVKKIFFIAFLGSSAQDNSDSIIPLKLPAR